MIRQKKGQAAMEFLMTYGWAILAAVIVVGVLWYMIGNPANLAGNQFSIGAPLVQKGVNINTTVVNFNILNGGAESITVSAIDFSSTDCTSQAGLSTLVAVGDEQDFSVVCALTSGDRLNTDVTLRYTQGSSTFEQQAVGTISGRIQ
ncbi:hypothetical protein KAR91_61605 [Candidatus Pacearchaeota archaeon]|nr:hypothetical protein [Candidatus Pacearchaeota archaeon]